MDISVVEYTVKTEVIVVSKTNCFGKLKPLNLNLKAVVKAV